MSRRPRTAQVKSPLMGPGFTLAQVAFCTWKGDPFGFGYTPAFAPMSETVERRAGDEARVPLRRRDGNPE
jgi:hypothetical protein